MCTSALVVNENNLSWVLWNGPEALKNVDVFVN